MTAQRGLVERDREVDALAAAAERTAAGTGSVSVISGPPGIGKSALLDAARAAVEAAGISAFGARGGELEQEYPYGIMRQLFESALRSAAGADRELLLAGPARPAAVLLGAEYETAPGDPPALEHAFYWLALNLADTRPIALLVDDAHWADQPSLRSLIYLARRTVDLPIMVVVTTRSGEGPRADLLRRLAAEAHSLIEPAELTEGAVESLVHRRLADADDEFCHACHTATGGNPFLVSQLIGAIQASGIEPVAGNAGRLRNVGADGVRRSVLLRLAELSPQARPLAQALAVLNASERVDTLAELASVDADAAVAAIDELRGMQILADGEPFRFVHSIVQSAVYDDLDPRERSRLHDAAARQLAAAGGSPDAVAGHLLHTAPGADPWIVQQLVGAASTGLALSAPEAMASYLDRALREEVPGVDRVQMLLFLGGARFHTVEGGAVEPLTEALALATEPAMRAEISRALASALLTHGRGAEAWDLIDTMIGEFAPSPDLVIDMETYAASGMYSCLPGPQAYRERTESWHPDPQGTHARDRAMLAVQTWVAMTGCAPAADVETKARAALSSGTLIDDDQWSVCFEMATWGLITSGHCDEALRHLDEAIVSRREIGRLLRAASLLPMRAEVHRRLGRLGAAEEDARVAVDVIPPEQIYAPQPASALVMLLVDRGDTAGARAVLEQHGFDPHIPDGGVADILWLARGYLRAAEGDAGGALADVLRFGEISDELLRRNPAYWPWRYHAVQLLAQLRRYDDARVLAEEECRLAALTGNADAIALGRLGLGLAQPGPAGLALMGDAVAHLDSSQLVLERVRAQLLYGRELRLADQREQARDVLRVALDAATRMGAAGIADAAQRELLASGARPRRTTMTGLDALTPSERRVASLAAKGLTNRELAHTLYVTPKTVEAHLASTYRKLGISGKSALAALFSEVAPST